MTKQFITKDSGERKEFSTGMQRDTEDNKPRFDLIYPENTPLEETLIYRWAMLLSRGAIKYSPTSLYSPNSLLDYICNQVLLCQHVYYAKIKFLHLEDVKNVIVQSLRNVPPKEQERDILVSGAIMEYIVSSSVAPTMKNIYESKIQDMQKGKKGIALNGVEKKKILKDLRCINLSEKQTQDAGKEMQIPRKEDCYTEEGLQKKQVLCCYKNKIINVQSVIDLLQKSEQCILTMTIQQDMQEVIYVVVAITELECLASLFQLLQRQSLISRSLQLKSLLHNTNQIEIKENRNWEKASTLEEYNRFKSSACRHFAQLMAGDDEEDHYAAVCFNLQGMIFVQNKLNKLQQ